MNAIKAIKADAKYYLTMLIVRGLYMPATLIISFNHIIDLGHMTGLSGAQAKVAPFLVDGFALLGMLFRSFSDEAMRAFGLKMQVIAGIASFAANILAGRNAGERAFGALVVIAFVVAERAGEFAHKRHVATIAQRQADEEAARVAAEVAAKRSAAGRKAAATKARKATESAAKAPAKRLRAV